MDGLADGSADGSADGTADGSVDGSVNDSVEALLSLVASCSGLDIVLDWSRGLNLTSSRAGRLFRSTKVDRIKRAFEERSIVGNLQVMCHFLFGFLLGILVY